MVEKKDGQTAVAEAIRILKEFHGNLAGADEKLANMKTELDSTRAKLGADQQSIVKIKEKYEMTYKQMTIMIDHYNTINLINKRSVNT